MGGLICANHSFAAFSAIGCRKIPCYTSTRSFLAKVIHASVINLLKLSVNFCKKLQKFGSFNVVVLHSVG